MRSRRFEKLRRVEQIWKEHAIDEKARAVLNYDRKFSDLTRERERAFLLSPRDVCFPTTTSTSFIRLTGLKKCRPMTRSGEPVLAASSQIGSAEVFVARIVVSAVLSARSAKDLLFDFEFFGRRFDHDLDGAHLDRAVEATMQARPSFAFSSLINPRFTASA